MQFLFTDQVGIPFSPSSPSVSIAKPHTWCLYGELDFLQWPHCFTKQHSCKCTLRLLHRSPGNLSILELLILSINKTILPGCPSHTAGCLLNTQQSFHQHCNLDKAQERTSHPISLSLSGGKMLLGIQVKSSSCLAAIT